MRRLFGVVDQWFETGSEGVEWFFYENGKKEWEAANIIDAGDHLTVYGSDNQTIFEGEIVPDYKVGWTKYPKNPKYGQQAALGRWVHWIQKGWKPDDWARLFIRKEGESLLRAELIKKEKIKVTKKKTKDKKKKTKKKKDKAKKKK